MINLSRSNSQNLIEMNTFPNRLYNDEILKKQSSMLLQEAQTMGRKFNTLVNYAHSQGIKVSKQIEHMNRVLGDQPEPHQIHQNRTIILLHEITMRRLYCNQIELKLSKKSSQRLHNQEVLNKQTKNLKTDVSSLEYAFEKWVKIAHHAGVNVMSQIQKMEQVLMDLPDPEDTHQLAAVSLLYQIVMRKIYCNQIIRKVAESLIIKTAMEARTIPKLQTKLGLIDRCEQYLLKMLPDELSKEPIAKAESQYDAILYELERMEKKLLSNNGSFG